MLSILIPVYNYNPARLIIELHRQAVSAGVAFEIILGDDASQVEYQQIYKSFLSVDEVKLIRNAERRGRAATRNLLAGAAVYSWLLFLDADAEITDQHFLKRYISICNEGSAEVIVGGTSYYGQPPKEPDKFLRWYYGKMREERPASIRQNSPCKSFSAFNFIAARQLFDKVRFNEKLRGYGHEDTLFGMDLEQNHFRPFHIENPAVHTGLEPAELFLEKCREGIRNLFLIYNQVGNAMGRYNRLLRAHLFFRSLGLRFMFIFLFNKLQSILERKLRYSPPKLYFFDLYRFLYSFTLKSKESLLEE